MKSIRTRTHFLIYRYRFLLMFILYGMLSLVLELLVIRTLCSFGLNYWLASFIGVTAGIFFAFVMNVRFNFKVVPSKRLKALVYFSVISISAFGIQTLFRNWIAAWGVSFEVSRFLFAGSLFLLSYWLHRIITFREYKKIGVAIYADGVEDIGKIYSLISDVCDFIHIDIVDSSFNPDCAPTKAYRAEVIRAYWHKKPLDVHIMSRTPSQWLPEIMPYVDTIYLHPSIDEDLRELLLRIAAAGCRPGIALTVNETLQQLLPHLDLVKDILLLSIPRPGFSGQKFDSSTLERISAIDRLPQRSEIELCVDGGVNSEVIGILNVDKAVSGSFVLKAANPVEQIMLLQTSGAYHGA